MRADLVFKKRFTFEYWKPVTTDGVVSYEQTSTAVGQIVPVAGGVVSLNTDVRMADEGMIRNLRDASGSLVFTTDGTAVDMFIQSSEPILDMWDNVSGYRHQLRSTLPARSRAAALGL